VAQVIVELSGDERKVLEAYKKAREADKALRESTSSTAVAGAKAANEYASSWLKAGKDAATSVEGLIGELRKTGPEGQQAAKLISAEMQKSGRDSGEAFQSVIDYLKATNPAAAEAAIGIRREMEQAAKDSQFKETLDALRNLGPEGKAIADSISVELKQSAAASVGSLDTIVSKLGELNPKAREVAERVQAELSEAARETNFNVLVDRLRELSPEAAKVAAGIKAEMKQSGQDSAMAFEGIIDQMRALDPAAAAAAKRIQARMEEADRESQMRQTLDSMRQLGGESAEIASQIEKELKTAAIEAAGGMDALLAKVRDLNPASAEAAERIKAELAEAAKFGEGKFEDTLKKLRSMGPVGRQVAEELKKHLVASGQVVEQSIDDVIDKLREIDPAAADAARALHEKAEAAAGKSESAFRRFGKSAVGQITSIAGAYVGIQNAIQLVIDLNRKVIETNKEAFESVKRQEDGDRRLLQVSADADDFQELRTRADDLAQTHGISREDARQLMFSARSEGFEDTTDFIASNQQVLDVTSQAQVAGQLPGLFQTEGLTGEQAIEGTFAAAKESRLSFEEIGSALPSASEGGALAGATSSETMAALSVMASRFGSASTAADRFKAFTSAVGMDQGDAGDTPEELAAKQEAEDDRAERAQRSFRTLEERVQDTRENIESVQAGPQTDATQKRLADLQKKLERAERAVAEFDQSTLQAQEIESSAPRESLAGKGFIEAVKALNAMPEEQRREFLGESQEVNAAFTIATEELQAIIDRQQTISDAMGRTGTDQAPTALAREAAAADPKLVTARDAARSEIALEIEREDKRAVTEGQRQRRKNDALRAAETSGASSTRIAAAEMVGETIEGFGGDASMAIPTLVGDSLANLERDLSQTVRAGGDDLAQRTLLAVGTLQRRRTQDPEAILGVDDTATFLSTPDNLVTPDQVTRQQQEQLTAAIIEQANEAQGLQRSVFTSLFNAVGMANPDAASAGESAVQNIAAQMTQTAPISETVQPAVEDAPPRVIADSSTPVVRPVMDAPTSETVQPVVEDAPLLPADFDQAATDREAAAQTRGFGSESVEAEIEDTPLAADVPPPAAPRRPLRPGIVNADQAAADLDTASRAAGVGTKSNDATAQKLDEQNELMRKQNELLAKQTALMEQQTAAADQTATNTKPRAPKPSPSAEIARAARTP